MTIGRKNSKSKSDLELDLELADLPPEMRWNEWKARVEAVLFATPEPATRETLTRVIGRDCALDQLLDDLKHDLRGRPYELIRAGQGYSLRTKAAFAPALRTAFAISADARTLTKLEAAVLMAIAYFQPITRADLTEMFGREVSRDLIASLRDKRLISAGPRSPQPGAPIAYVTTERFLVEFGFGSLADLPTLESLKDAGLINEPEPQELRP